MPVLKLTLGRLVQAVILLFVMSVIGFAGIHAIGNPVFNVVNLETASADDIRRATIALGLDQPIWRQYLLFLGNVLRGDFGTSYNYHQSAFALLVGKLPATLELSLSAMVVAAPLGVAIGLAAGRQPGSMLDRSLLSTGIFALSIPSFWMSMMLILVGAVETGWFPSGGRGATIVIAGLEWSFATVDGLWHLLLPTLALAIPNIALIARLTRAGTIETERMEFLRFCRAKGISSRHILLRHTLPNISAPVITIIGLQFGGMLAFAVVVESIFSWPGIGKLLIDSIQLLDRPVVMACLTFISIAFVALNAVVDIVQATLDPRIRLSA